MSGPLIFETKFGVGPGMTRRDRNEAWEELRRLAVQDEARIALQIEKLRTEGH